LSASCWWKKAPKDIAWVAPFGPAYHQGGERRRRRLPVEQRAAYLAEHSGPNSLLYTLLADHRAGLRHRRAAAHPRALLHQSRRCRRQANDDVG